jgi:hypothetical protein
MSETDSEKEREMENMRVRMATLENELMQAQKLIRETASEKVRYEAELEKIRTNRPQTNEPRTDEQTAAREFVQQWTTGDTQRRRVVPEENTHDSTQSTMTSLANRMKKLSVDPVEKVLRDIGVSIPKTPAAPQPKESARLHLVPAEEQQIKNFATQNEQEAKVLRIQATMLSLVKTLNEEHNGRYQTLVDSVREDAQNTAIQLTDTHAKISKVKALAARFNTVVPIPVIEPEPYGFVRDRDSFDIRNIKDRVPPFDPEKEPNRCFAKIMKDLMGMAKGQYLQERHWFHMLENVLRGEAREEYTMARENDWDLTRTIEHLGTLYAHSKTIEDDKRELEAFARRPNEEISRAMARLRVKIGKLEHLYDAHAFPAIVEARLLTGLNALISSKTKAYLDTESIRATIAGAPFTVETLTKMADIYEKTHNEIPTMTLTCGTNSVELQKKVTQQAALLKTLQKDSNKTLEVSKKLEDLLQVAAATYKRERSAERKSTSSKPAYQQRSKSSEKQHSDGDVLMQDVGQTQNLYPNKQFRADQSTEDKLKAEKQRLKEEYRQLKQSQQGQKQQQGFQQQRSNSGDRSRGRSSTPRPAYERSSSNSSHKSGQGNSRSNSADSSKEAGLTHVTVDVFSRSNYYNCQICTLKHPPYEEFCPAKGNQ